MWPNLQFPADLTTFTEGILKVKLLFLCSVDAETEVRISMLPLIYKISKTHTLHNSDSEREKIITDNSYLITGICRFGHIYWRNPQWKTSFFVQCKWFERYRKDQCSNILFSETSLICPVKAWWNNVLYKLDHHMINFV